MNGFGLNGDSAYLLLIVGALFVHACYQLSVSVLTYLSSHSLSRQVSTRRLLWLGSHYTLGAIVTTALILLGIVSLASLSSSLYNTPAVTTFLLLTVTLVPFVGLTTVLFYFRPGQGTQLWLPRPIAQYLLERSRKTRSGVEASMLGAATVVGELPFIIGPLLLIALLLVGQPSGLWLGAATVYALLASLPLMIVTLYLTSGHSVARVQRWREENKKFLQWTSGIALVLLTLYVTVLQIGTTL